MRGTAKFSTVVWSLLISCATGAGCGGATRTLRPPPTVDSAAARPGTITTLCGDDSSGWNGDGRPARETRFSYPVAIAFDREGRLVVVDSGNHRVRRIERDGRVSTILGGDGAGGEHPTEHPRPHEHPGHQSSGDVGSDAPRPHHPFDVAADADGSILVAGNVDPRIYRIAPNDGVTIVAGGDSAGFDGDGGAATRALLRSPLGVAAAPDGSILIADTGNHRVRCVSPDGVMETVAGTGEPGSSGDDGPAADARLKGPVRVSVDPIDGALLIADKGNHRVRRVAPDGTITTIAGTGEAGFAGDDGPAVAARLDSPEEARRGPDGAIYISDSANHRVRRVRGDGTIETVAGDGVSATRGDGGDARAASLRHPSGLAFDARGDLAIAEAYGHCVRLVLLGPRR